jgi:Restriction endonuclease
VDEPRVATPTAEITDQDIEKSDRSFVLESAEGQALAEIEEYVNALSPYEFQEVVAALLRGMGYATPFEAGRGPDGGTDILAYPDPIGVNTPRIRVQVKHRPSQKSTREEIATLRGVIRQDRDIGLFVSTSGFTNDAIREARHGATHIELMELDRFLDQWKAPTDHRARRRRAHRSRTRRVDLCTCALCTETRLQEYRSYEGAHHSLGGRAAPPCRLPRKVGRLCRDSLWWRQSRSRRVPDHDRVV